VAGAGRKGFRRLLATRVTTIAGWASFGAVIMVFAAAMAQWGEVVFQVVMVLFGAIAGAFAGFWIAAEWTNVDDRAMVGDPFPFVAIITSTVVGTLLVGGAVLLGTLRWA
jgi:hypothetical protein